ncbi:hypothetical protein AAFF_G00214720 [Aldrovandia affinis]|uniref:Gamma-secretase subunit APH-1 n=1 Tax=Aldrovandia affinis TaxID=143900 RepID=A0AAD7RGT2_9TELE|nr:hypothetical protein AAFF_G00214720 [Aldrovandia affinis]
MAKKYDFLFKLLLIGDSGVGKTCLIIRFAEDNFNSTYISTIGIDFKVKTIEVEGKKVKLQVWDTAGQERFKTITTAYYRGAMGIILVYDITDEKSFENIQNWMKSIKENASSGVSRMLLGNKCDIEAKRKVSKETGEKLAKDHGIRFFETSAKSSINVEESFIALARDILLKSSKKPGPTGREVRLTTTQKKSSKCSPVRVIILVVGASLWLVSLLLSSVLWYALVSICDRADASLQLKLLATGAAVAVLLQEMFRAALYKLLRKTNSGLFRVKGVPPLSLQQKALVSGLAFGLMSSAFSFANILSLSLGPGIVGIHGESSHFFITSALQSMMQTCLHICWSVLLFSACERASRVRGVAVVMTHLLSCGLSFLNPRYYLSLLLQCVLVAAVVIWAWVEAGGRGCPDWLGVGDKPLVKVETVQYSALRSPVEN